MDIPTDEEIWRETHEALKEVRELLQAERALLEEFRVLLARAFNQHDPDQR